MSFMIPLMSSNVKFQGRKVTYRSFVILNMRNIKNLSFFYNTRYDSIAPTSFEDNLVHGTTNNYPFQNTSGEEF